jgi:hypothetical protein
VKAAGQPLFQFLALGAIFYVLYAWIGGASTVESNKVIQVTAADVNRLDATWRAQYNRAPTNEELLGLVKDHVREIALYRHAVAMGLDQNDVTIRRMLGQKLQTLTQNLVELSLSPTEQELSTYFATNTERYRDPALITFTHIFLDPDQRGDDTLADAERALAELRSLEEPTEDVERFGDRFMLQKYYPRKSALEIQKQLGQGFTQSLFELSPGAWHGPVLSGYGVHLVYVHDLEESPSPEFADAQERVKQDWMDERRRELQDEYMSEVMASYEVVFDELPPEQDSEAPDQLAEAKTETSK